MSRGTGRAPGWRCPNGDPSRRPDRFDAMRAKGYPKERGYTRSDRQSVSLLCQRCGFQAVDRCQIDVHHKDGNHENDTPENREEICANCHRLEHFAKG